MCSADSSWGQVRVEGCAVEASRLAHLCTLAHPKTVSPLSVDGGPSGYGTFRPV